MKLGRKVVNKLMRLAPAYKKVLKARFATSHIVDIGEPPLPPPFHPPPQASRADVFKGKGRRLADDDPVVNKGVIRIHDKKPTVRSKPGGLAGERGAKQTPS